MFAVLYIFAHVCTDLHIITHICWGKARAGSPGHRAKVSILAEERHQNEKPVVAWNGKRS